MKKNSTNQKHVPMRTCIVSRVKKPKKELIRIVRTPEDQLMIDLKGKQKGRGASIDMNVELFEKAISKGILQRALKFERKFTDEEISKLREEFVAAIEEKKFRDGNKPVKIRVKKEDMKKIMNNE